MLFVDRIVIEEFPVEFLGYWIVSHSFQEVAIGVKEIKSLKFAPVVRPLFRELAAEFAD